MRTITLLLLLLLLPSPLVSVPTAPTAHLFCSFLNLSDSCCCFTALLPPPSFYLFYSPSVPIFDNPHLLTHSFCIFAAPMEIMFDY